MAQIGYFHASEVTFRSLCVQHVLSQYVKGNLEVLHMLLHYFVLYKNIIKNHKYEFSQMGPKYLIH